MEPNQVVKQAPVQSAPVVPKDSIVRDSGTKKGGKGAVIGMVIFAILALGGIGFGVWTWMDKNQQVDILNKQIQDLKNNISSSESNDDDDYVNPIISSSESDKYYSVSFESSKIANDDGSETDEISITVKDGSITNCYVSRYGNGGSIRSEECSIDGVSGEIYKIVEFGSGQDNYRSNIGFIMEDGSIQYFPLHNITDGNSFSLDGEISIDGFVVDVFDILVGVEVAPDEGYGYGSSAFILNDGTFVVYDESMLNQ